MTPAEPLLARGYMRVCRSIKPTIPKLVSPLELEPGIRRVAFQALQARPEATTGPASIQPETKCKRQRVTKKLDKSHSHRTWFFTRESPSKLLSVRSEGLAWSWSERSVPPATIVETAMSLPGPCSVLHLRVYF